MTGTESNSAKQLDKHASQISKRTFQYFFCSSCFITKQSAEKPMHIYPSQQRPLFFLFRMILFYSIIIDIRVFLPYKKITVLKTWLSWSTRKNRSITFYKEKKIQKYNYEFRKMPEEHKIYQELRTCTIEGNAAIKWFWQIAISLMLPVCGSHQPSGQLEPKMYYYIEIWSTMKVWIRIMRMTFQEKLKL